MLTLRAACSSVSAQQQSLRSPHTVEWRDDVDYLERELPRRHAAPFRGSSDAGFHARIDSMRCRLDSIPSRAVPLAIGGVHAGAPSS